MSVFLVAPKCSLPAPLFIFDSFLSQSIHFRHKFVSSLFSLVAPKKKEADARSDLQSDRNEYKDLQSDYRIANAYTQRDWIANPVEPLPIPSSHIVKIPTREIFTSGPYFFTSGLRMKKWRPLFFTSGPLFFVPGPGTFFYHPSPLINKHRLPTILPPPFTLHPPPLLGATKKSLTRVRRARAREEKRALCALCVEIVPQKTFIAQQKRCDERFFLTFVTLFFHREQQKQ